MRDLIIKHLLAAGVILALLALEEWVPGLIQGLADKNKKRGEEYA